MTHITQNDIENIISFLKREESATRAYIEEFQHEADRQEQEAADAGRGEASDKPRREDDAEN